MPGKASLLAAVQPGPTKALYFVARGDGSSQFSATLDEHNRRYSATSSAADPTVLTDFTHASGGLFISFEGIDGAGKSTHIARTGRRRFATQGRRVTLTREPGGTPLAEKLRALVLNDAMDPLTEALLMFAARRDHLLQVIEPALARGDVVLCDRFTDATFAYQGAGRGFDLEVLATLGALGAVGAAWPAGTLRQPDLTVWFDLRAGSGRRAPGGARVPDKFESQPVEFFARVAAGYAARMERRDPGALPASTPTSRATEVWQQVFGAVRALGAGST